MCTKDLPVQGFAWILKLEFEEELRSVFRPEPLIQHLPDLAHSEISLGLLVTKFLLNFVKYVEL